ncbi:Spore coat protein SA [Gimesia maris]|uniref:glycosyltransferase n=1 Tax=Gimesia maris TaxID=122 RepID=UPI00118D0C63|nr:glycosyltransferase [Gimesia maris]QDT76780.1 Spore coat protein SA [Gimesia maris]
MPEKYQLACEHARSGVLTEAERLFQELAKAEQGRGLSLVLNNLGAVKAALGDSHAASQFFEEALTVTAGYEPSVQNLNFLAQLSGRNAENEHAQNHSSARRIAIVSLLFNWPSTGGGTVHTKELAQFLVLAGYDVHQFYATYQDWGIGVVSDDLPYLATPLVFDANTWDEEKIRARFKTAVDRFSPDAVIVTDSWNTKPLLAEAVQDYPYYIRLAALECICPLNNVRLLTGGQHQLLQCPQNQLADADACHQCVISNLRRSGQLHQLERQLAGFDKADYGARLRVAFAKAEGALVVNPQIAELVRSYTRSVHVLPSGFDVNRFPASLAEPAVARPRKRILFAGLTSEFIKGFSVLLQAGEQLWKQRQDFEIWATADPVGQINEFTRFVGWQSQESLPALISECDILVFPTLAQEALGRTAVEAMGCGRPVIASRLGGLPFVVEERVTGLLCNPADPTDLAEKCQQLLDAPELCHQMGKAGRAKFLNEYTWELILQNYFELFGPPVEACQKLTSKN